ncbi:GPO family capsid scaffolding protein [Wohlfahrtiimonas larvae]|uniref:GPO family capsid scaffolding protein n=1 Tax=Wohlfahrtiimonas larvae TaxID=1157986 RepID=A0ABP9MJ88_9GAMM|nr:GPO family capsid scaffolding protein [Wohlfahrtiimonas larvae]
MNKKTKFTRIAVSGKTVDGREITKEQINQMAASYDPAKYTANIWLEHYRGVMADGAFKSLGTVLAVKAEDYKINGQTERALYAELEVTEDFVTMFENSQKKAFSVEIYPNFAETGQAYLGGLGATDSPASLGTEAMKFNLHARQNKESNFSTALEFIGIDFAEENDQTGAAVFEVNEKGFFKNMFAGLFAAQKEQAEPQPMSQPKSEDHHFNIADLESVLNQFAEKQDKVIAKLTQENKTLSDAFNALKTEFETLKNTAAPENHNEFVAGDGEKNEYLADC